MFWGAHGDDDPGMENRGGCGYMPNFYDYTIVYGGNRDKIFVFDPKSILVAITDDIEEAEQLVLSAVRSNSKVQDQQSKLATTNPMFQLLQQPHTYRNCQTLVYALLL